MDGECLLFQLLHSPNLAPAHVYVELNNPCYVFSYYFSLFREFFHAEIRVKCSHLSFGTMCVIYGDGSPSIRFREVRLSD